MCNKPIILDSSDEFEVVVSPVLTNENTLHGDTFNYNPMSTVYHKPSGLVASCCLHRSAAKNTEIAIAKLKTNFEPEVSNV